MHSFTGAVEVNHSFSKIELKSAEQCASTLVAPLEAYLSGRRYSEARTYGSAWKSESAKKCTRFSS